MTRFPFYNQRLDALPSEIKLRLLNGEWNDMDRTDNGEARHIMQFFAYDHLPAGPMRRTSQACCELADRMMSDLDIPNGPEKSAGMRKLLEAKDCFVRAALAKPKADL